jgi:hypothetical protein
MTKLAGSGTRIQDPDLLVRGMDPRSRITPKCHGSATLLPAVIGLIIVSASAIGLAFVDVLCCTRSPCAVLGVPVATGIPSVAFVVTAVVRIQSVLAVLAVTLLASLRSLASILLEALSDVRTVYDVLE